MNTLNDGPRTFRKVLASTVSFFLLAVMAIILGFTRGDGFVAPSFGSSPPRVMFVFCVGLGFPAFTAFCLLLAWVRYSEDRHALARRLALFPWVYFSVFLALLVLVVRAR